MLILFGISFSMYHKGAFIYPYLEDDDSWNHAIGVKYVSLEKTVFAREDQKIRYADPYPPTYDMLIGIMHQTHDSLYWGLKFFNALIISMSLIYFFFFVKVFTKSSKKALFSSLALFAMPAFMSHFIWALSLTMALFFVPFYCVEKIKDDKKWWIIAAIVIVPTVTSSLTHSTFFGLFLLMFIGVKTLLERKLLKWEYLAGLGGVILTLILWWIPVLISKGFRTVLKNLTGKQIPTSGKSLISIVNHSGTGDRYYSIMDFIVAKKQNMINNPIGIGVVISIFVILILLYLGIRYYKHFKSNYKLTLISGFILNIIFILVIYYGNTKRYLPDGTRIFYDRLEIPFSEFFSDQKFLIFGMLFLSLLIIYFINLNFKNLLKQKYLLIVLVWFTFSFYAVKAAPFTYKLSPFRSWMILAIPTAILFGEGVNLFINFIKSVLKSIIGNKKIILVIVSLIFLGIITFGVVKTSYDQKYAVNTAQWSAGGFWTFVQDEEGRVSSPELAAYVWFKDNIDIDSSVFTFSNNALIIGNDKFTCHWCIEVRDYQDNGFNLTAEENYNWFKEKGYEYVILDSQAVKKFSSDEVNVKIQDYINSSQYNPVINNNAVIIFEIV
tara:strand:- start:240 stop:2066 length:1827 start_codon:yes stop_codon:yes gene_type:complete